MRFDWSTAIIFFIAFLLGSIFTAITTPRAQLAPFDAPLEEQLNGQRQEHFLRMERDLERRSYQRDDPCRR